MVSHFEAVLTQFSIHKVGNKLSEELLTLSAQPLKVTDEVLGNLLMQYFLSPFEKVNEAYRFAHPTDNLQLNEIFHFAELIFSKEDTFHQNTEQIARHLYDIANHPKIKSGELYVCHF